MKLFRPRSLQLRLAVRLGALLVVATVLAAATFVYLGYRTADSLSRRDLFRVSDELAESVAADGSVQSLDSLRRRGLLSQDTVFAIRDDSGRVIAASGDAIRAVAAQRPLPGRRPDFFRLSRFDGERDYLGIVLRERSPIGPLAVMIAEPDDPEDELFNALLYEIVFEAAWIVPVFIVITLLVGVYAIRGGLRPLRETAEQAATINPEAMSVRLSTDNLPSEVSPFVNTVNRALDRLEKGFALQRRFTANAAHELRTPLAIITAALDGMEGNGKLEKIQQDVARMNRLVDQLLHVARLDNVSLDVYGETDLRACARNVVEYMAPLAIEQERSVALSSVSEPVSVIGNAHAIEDALRNLIENALIHTPAHSEVLVAVGTDGSVSVSDRGQGVPPEDRERIFDRFWRGQGAPGAGAGLGLAIVREIMKLHGGSVELANNPGGGARFILRFRPVQGTRGSRNVANDRQGH